MATLDDLSKLRIDPQQKLRRGKLRRWRLLLWLVPLAALVTLFWAYPYVVPQPVEIALVKRTDPEAETSSVVLSVAGYVIPHRRIELAPKVIARVKKIYADKGDKVEKGAPLVQLEDTEYRASYERARAQVAKAKAVLSELTAGKRPQEIEQAQAEQALAEATQRDAAQTLKRLMSLVAQRAESQQALDKAKNDFDVATARVNVARKNLELARIGTRVEQIRAAQASVEEAEANAAYAKTQLDDCLILAPVSGTILERLAEEGELVTNMSFGGGRGARTALMSMADLNDMQVEIDLNQSDLARVHLGQHCIVSLEAYPDREYAGKVEQIAPEANRQKATVQVKVQILKPDERVRPELNARVSFLELIHPREGKQPEPKIFVPSNAIVEREGSPVVAVVNHGRAKLIRIRRGAETPNGVEVLQGLSGRERVIIRPPDGLKDGAAVKNKDMEKQG